MNDSSTLRSVFVAWIGMSAIAFAAPPAITAGDPPPAGTVGQAYFYDFDITPIPHSFGVQNLPPGLELNPSDFSIAGTPDQAGSYDAVIFAANDNGEETRITRRIVISPTAVADDFVAPSIQITNMVVHTLPGENHFEFEFYFLASDDQALASPYALEFRGAVANGPLDDWKPYPYQGPDTPLVITLYCFAFEFEVRAVDAAGNRSLAANKKFLAPGYSLSSPPEFATPKPASGRVGKPFSYRIKCTGATRFSASGLPPGCKLNKKRGVITGTPTKAGTFRAKITVGNKAGNSTQKLRIKITGG